jgi:hypothetical protein
MPDDMLVAYERARELVGEGMWLKLSENTRANALIEELRALDAERAATAAPRVDTLTVGNSSRSYFDAIAAG